MKMMVRGDHHKFVKNNRNKAKIMFSMINTNWRQQIFFKNMNSLCYAAQTNSKFIFTSLPTH